MKHRCADAKPTTVGSALGASKCCCLHRVVITAAVVLLWPGYQEIFGRPSWPSPLSRSTSLLEAAVSLVTHARSAMVSCWRRSLVGVQQLTFTFPPPLLSKLMTLVLEVNSVSLHGKTQPRTEAPVACTCSYHPGRMHSRKTAACQQLICSLPLLYCRLQTVRCRRVIFCTKLTDDIYV